MIQIRRRPYLLNFTGNPIAYDFFDNAAIGNPDITFEVKVMFAALGDGIPTQQLAIIPLKPHLGIGTIDISHLLDCNLKFFEPALGISCQSTGSQSGVFYVEYRSVSLEATNPAWISSESTQMRYAFKGGISTYQWINNNFFETYHPQTLCFFTWQKRGRLTGINEKLFLAWLNKDYNSVDVTNLYLKAVVTFTDSTVASTQYLLTSPYNRFFFFFLAVGAGQLNLQALDPNKKIWFWDVWVIDVEGGGEVQVSEKYRFVNDMRNDYNDVSIHYRNSLGGLDTIRIRGVIETNINLDGSDAEVAAAADWAFASTVARMDKSLPHREQRSFKGDIGHLNKEEQDRLRDAFLNREVYQEYRGRLLPVKLLTKQYRQRATNDKRFSMPMEWMRADGGSYHYTPDIDLGAGLNSTNVCATQMGLNISGITWDGANATVTVHWGVFGDAVGLQYRIPGYVEDWTDVNPFAFVGDFEYTVGKDQFVTFHFRAACAPGVYGPSHSVTANTTEVPPVPNSNVRNDTAVPFNFILTRNGTQIAAGSVNPGELAPFYCPTGAANFAMQVTGVSPVEATLSVSDGGVFGTIVGGSITWPIIGPDAAGILIIIT